MYVGEACCRTATEGAFPRFQLRQRGKVLTVSPPLRFRFHIKAARVSSVDGYAATTPPEHDVFAANLQLDVSTLSLEFCSRDALGLSVCCGEDVKKGIRCSG